MKIIEEQSQLISKTLGKQMINTETAVRPLSYVRSIPVKEGTLLFNILSGELLLLDETEIEYFAPQHKVANSTVKQLVEKWFLVPENTDDCQLSKQLVTVINSINNIFSSPQISSFTILPTTDCNARCFYCFELGCSRKWMTEETAMSVVDYIMRKKADGEIKIRWFGGEPLYNSKIIDIISSELKKHGVKYHCNMTTNGYLFDEDMIDRAKNLWNLQKIQITLDGTEKIYNKTKAYIYKNDPSPFKRVIKNIKNLLERGMEVVIRINMDLHNVDDSFDLTKYLLEEFKGFNNYFINPHLLYENSCKFKTNDTDKDDNYLNKKYNELREIVSKALNKQSKYTRIMRFSNHCLADTDTSVMILPEGQLGKCEHYTDDHYIGSIFDDKLDLDMITWFKQTTTVMPECDNCELRPACIYLKCCPAHSKKCSPSDKATRAISLDNHIKYIYNHLKNKKA